MIQIQSGGPRPATHFIGPPETPVLLSEGVVVFFTDLVSLLEDD